jgi:predicted RNA-binding protein with PIN domain
VELVDEVGVLWLSRPEGWAHTISTLVPPTIVDERAALHRAERRRQAAQNAAARTRAELLGLRGELERERSARVSVEADVDRLRSELDDLRQRLRQAQRAEHVAAQALVKAETELDDVRRALPDVSPPPGPIEVEVDVGAVTAWIDGALSASADVVRLLSAALSEIAPLDKVVEPELEQSLVHRRVRRSPIRLAGGVLAGSVEAAEFLLRTKGAKTLIDGYNVAKLGWPSLDLDHQREQCVVACENLAKRWNLALAVVFDGAEIEGAHAPSRRRVRVAYSPAGVSADDVLRAEVAKIDASQPVVVVTNDRAIISDVVASGANTVSSDDFLVVLRR